MSSFWLIVTKRNWTGHCGTGIIGLACDDIMPGDGKQH